MAQRYAMLRNSTEDDDRLHFWVGEASVFHRVAVFNRRRFFS